MTSLSEEEQARLAGYILDNPMFDLVLDEIRKDQLLIIEASAYGHKDEREQAYTVLAALKLVKPRFERFSPRNGKALGAPVAPLSGKAQGAPAKH